MCPPPPNDWLCSDVQPHLVTISEAPTAIIPTCQYCGEPPWPRGSVLDLRPPGFEFRILCLEDSAISIISPSSGGSSGPVQPICALRWPKARFISFTNLYHMFFAYFSVNAQPIFMKFCKDVCRVTRRLPWNCHWKILHSWKGKPFGM